MTKKWIKRIFVWLGLPALLSISTGFTAEEQSEFDCVIEPHMEVELSSRVDGILEKVLVDRGDHVKPNQLVARLESGVEKAAVEYARARTEMNAEIQSHQVSVNFGVRNQDRIAELHEKKAVSFTEVDQVRTETEIAKFSLLKAKENNQLAKLELARAEETLKRQSIRSPIRGVVVERYLNPGESVEDQPIIKVAQIDPLRVEVVVPINQHGRIKVGDKGLVTPEFAVGGEYESKVEIVDSVFDAASGTFRVRLSLPNPDYKLTSGLKCRVRFPRGPQPGTAKTQNRGKSPAG